MSAAPTAVLNETRSETTARLFAERRDAPTDERAQIEEALIRLNMKVAVDATRRFRSRGIATDDLEQVAYVGLVKAVRGFDPDRGFDFLSFAIPTIRGEVRRHFRDLGWAVRPPRSIQETQSKMIACEADASMTSDSLMAPTPVWMTRRRTSVCSTLLRASSRAPMASWAISPFSPPWRDSGMLSR